MTLAETRAQWEKKLTVVCIFPMIVEGFLKVFVILQKQNPPIYTLHRYVRRAANCWDVSVDKQNCTLADCLERINEDGEVQDLYSIVLEKENDPLPIW